MSGKEPALSPLELRKRLLIAESELNRAQLREDWQTLTEGVRGLADKAVVVSSYASVVAALVAGLAAFRYSKGPRVTGKLSWVGTILKGLRVAVSLWLAFRSRPREDE